MTALTTTEANELQRLERIIDRGRKTFVEVGTALKLIRDNELWKLATPRNGEDSYADFETYTLDRFEFSGSRARQMIAAAKVQSVTNVTLPNEAVARAIGKVPEADREDVLSRAVELTGDGTMTARSVQEAYDSIAPEDPSVDPDVSDEGDYSEAIGPRCPNCGSTKTDDDGDCAQCHEPGVAEAVVVQKATGFGVDIEKDIDKRRKQHGTSAAAARVILGNIADRLED